MIFKNFRFGKTENTTLVEFGHGTTISTTMKGIKEFGGESLTYRGMVVKSSEPNPIAMDLGMCESVDKFEPELIMIFFNEESLDVIMGQLKKIKEGFEADSLKKLEIKGESEEERWKRELRNSKKLIIRVDKNSNKEKDHEEETKK